MTASPAAQAAFDRHALKKALRPYHFRVGVNGPNDPKVSVYVVDAYGQPAAIGYGCMRNYPVALGNDAIVDACKAIYAAARLRDEEWTRDD